MGFNSAFKGLIMHSVNSLQFAQEGEKNTGIYMHNYLTKEANRVQQYQSHHISLQF
jgi:hypothetical protein